MFFASSEPYLWRSQATWRSLPLRLEGGEFYPAIFAPILAAVPTARRSVRQRWLCRVVSGALVPLVVLACLEGGLRLGGYGYPTGFFLHRETNGQRVLT